MPESAARVAQHVPPSPAATERESAWLVLLPIALAAFVFRPSPEQFFKGEDFYHIYRAANQPWAAFLLQQHSGHVYTAFSLLVAGCLTAFGMDAAGWYAVLFALHLLNVALCFRLLRVVTGDPHLAAIGALLWAVTPTHAEALTWFTLSGHVLATTMVLAVLGSAVACAARGHGPGRLRALAWMLAMPVAATGNAAGTAAVLVLPLVAFFMLPPGRVRRRIVATFVGGMALALMLVTVARLLTDQVPGMLPSGPAPVFPRGSHAEATALLFAELAKQGLIGPLLSVADPKPDASTTWLLGAAWVALAFVAAWRADRARRRALGGALLLLAAVYGATAIGRGGMYELLARAAEGEAGTLARYHYLATAAGMLATGIVARALLEGIRVPRALVRAAPLLVAAALGVAIRERPLVLDRRTQSRVAFERVRDDIAAAIRRAAPPGAVARVPNEHTGYLAGIVSHLTFPGWAAVFVLTHPEPTFEGRRVVFMEPAPRVRDLAESGVRTRNLLVVP